MEGARLLLHFEVDEILLAGDVEERVNAALARAAVVARKGRPASASDVASRSSSASAHRADPFGDFNWHDGSLPPVCRPPPLPCRSHTCRCIRQMMHR